MVKFKTALAKVIAVIIVKIYTCAIIIPYEYDNNKKSSRDGKGQEPRHYSKFKTWRVRGSFRVGNKEPHLCRVSKQRFFLVLVQNFQRPARLLERGLPWLGVCAEDVAFTNTLQVVTLSAQIAKEGHPGEGGG